MDALKNAELQKRRKQRIEQVREQSKIIASELRKKVAAEKKRKSEELAKSKCKELREWQDQQLKDLECIYRQNIENLGKAHKEAESEVDPNKILKENKKVQDHNAHNRGKNAMKTLKAELLEKTNKRKVKQKAFRSVLPETPKIKVTQTIKKGNNKKDDEFSYGDQELELISIDLDKFNSEVTRDKEERSLSGIDYSSKQRYTNLQSKPSAESIDKDWFCKCCKIQRDVGTQCLCSREEMQDLNKENKNYSNPAYLIRSKADQTDNENFFTQVSDRIRSRDFTDNLKKQTKLSNKVYNPDDFAYDKIQEKTKNYSEFLDHCKISQPSVETFRAASPLTEISAKIKQGIKCAKDCLNNIEPEVLELQKNAEFFDKRKSLTPEKQIKTCSSLQKEKLKDNKVEKSTSITGLSKVKLYDSHTKYEAMYKPSLNVVEKNDSSFECAQDMAQKESELFDKEISLRAQKRKDAMAKSRLRNREALNQKQNMKNLDDINRCLESLTILEKESNSYQNRGVPNPSHYKQNKSKSQEKVNEYLNSLLNKDAKVTKNKITLNRIRNTKAGGHKEISEHVPKRLSSPKPSTSKRRSSINVSKLNKNNIKNKVPDLPSCDDKSSTTSSSIIIGKIDNGETSSKEALKDLLDRVNRQKQLLLDEVPQNALPQNSKLNDVLDAVEKSLQDPIEKTFISNTTEEKNKVPLEVIRDMKKQRKKMARKEEELKMKELELDLLIQKYKINNLESKQINQVDKASTNIIPDVKILNNDKPVLVNTDTAQAMNLNIGSSSSDGVEIVIQVKDKSKKNAKSNSRKYFLNKASNTIHKRKLCKTKMKRSKKGTSLKVPSLACSSSSTSYMSPPAELFNVSNLRNMPKALVCDHSQTKQHFKKQTDVFNQSKSPTISVTKSRFVQRSVRKEKPKTNPLLVSYINRLLSMDKESLDALTVSSCSDVPTPSDSVIDITSNKPTMNKTNKKYTFEQPERPLEDTKPFIRKTPYKTEHKNMDVRTSIQVIEETPKRPVQKPVQSRGIQVSSINNHVSEENVEEKTQVEIRINDNLNKSEDMQSLSDDCNKRISNLVNLINKIRKEKLKLLENSLSTSSSYGQNSTEYLDLPSHIASHHLTKRENIDSSNKTADISKEICQETPPKFETTDEFIINQEINFKPMLIDIPKPSEIQQNILSQTSDKDTKGLENEITDIRQNMDGINKQLGNLENYMGQIHEYIGDVVKRKQKPPVSLLRQLKNNVNIDTGQAHELSAIMEVDTPMQTKISESNVEIITLESSLDSSKPEDTVDQLKITSIKSHSPHKESGDLKTFDSTLKNIFDNTGFSITLKSPSKSYEEKTNNLNLEIKPFPSFEEYAKILEKRSDGENIEKSGDRNDETLPDVLAELMRRNIIQKPFDNDTQNSDASTTETMGFSLKSPVQFNEAPEILNASISLFSDSSSENMSTSSSTPRDFEKALQQLGMNWAVNTLKKTQESIAHSSSSSIEYPSHSTKYLTKKILALKSLNELTMKELENSHKTFPSKVIIESTLTEDAGGVKKITQNTEFLKKFDNDRQKHELEEIVRKAQDISLDKESIFRQLLSSSKELSSASEINLMPVPTAQANQRTSTPVMGDRKFSSSSKGISLNETLFSGSNLSSVKNNSSDNGNGHNSNL